MSGNPPPSGDAPLPLYHEFDPFHDVRIRSKTKEPHLQQAYIVLTALTEVLNEQGINASSTKANIIAAYFGALMVSLEQKDKHAVDTLGGITYLLAVIFPQLPAAILRNNFDDISQLLMDILEKYSEHTSIVRAIITCIALLLQSLDPLHSQSFLHTSHQHLFQSLLIYSLDSRPKLRHNAQERLHDLLITLYESKRGIPNILIQSIVSFASREIGQCTIKECQEVLYICGLLQIISGLLDYQSMSKLLEMLLTLTSSQNSILYVQVMRTIQTFATQENDHIAVNIQHEATTATTKPSLSDKQQARYVSLLDKLLAILPSLTPHPSDIESNIAFSQTSLSLFTAMTANNSQIKTGAHLPTYFSLLSSYLLSPKPTVIKIASQTIVAMLQGNVSREWLEDNLAVDSDTLKRDGGVMTLMKAAESLLGYRYKSVWSQVFPIITSVFASFSPAIGVGVPAGILPQLLTSLITTLDSFRKTEEIAKEYQSLLDESIGAAVAYHGPTFVLNILPLDLPLDNNLNAAEFTQALEQSRSWLLPIIRTYTRHTTINTFFHTLLPQIQQLKSLQNHYVEHNNTTHERACQLLIEQLWDTFPAFCLYPTDVAISFKSYAKVIGDWLSNDENQYAHSLVCRGLTLLIAKHQQVAELEKERQRRLQREAEVENVQETERLFAEEEEDEDAEEGILSSTRQLNQLSTLSLSTSSRTDNQLSKFAIDPSAIPVSVAGDNLRILSGYAKNFLPLLFNLVSRQDQKKDITLECISVYASISDAATINTLFKRALKKLLETNAAAIQDNSVMAGEHEKEKSHVLADIVLAMTNSLDGENLTFLYRSLGAQLISQDAIIQKKAYKILAAICMAHHSFFSQHWQEILNTVTDATDKLLPSAMKVRLVCIKALCLPIPALLTYRPDAIKPWLSRLPGLIGEVLLALKDSSFKTRSAAYAFVSEIGEVMREGDQIIHINTTSSNNDHLTSLITTWGLTHPISTDSPLFSEYLLMLLGGLSGTSPHMQSATIMAFSHLIFSCRHSLPSALSYNMLPSFLPLLDSKSREVRKSMMGFIKVISLCLPVDEILAHARVLLNGLGVWGEDKKNRFQEKIRIILEILIRKLGVDVVKSFLPQQQHKLIDHIKKSKLREQRQKTEIWEEKKKQYKEKNEIEMKDLYHKKSNNDFDAVLHNSDEEDQNDNDNDEQPSISRRRRRERNREDGLIMKEDTEDLLSSGMITNISKRQSQINRTMSYSDDTKQQEKKLKKKAEFKENKDGKLLIMEDNDREDKDEGVDNNGMNEEARQTSMMNKSNKKRGRDDNDELRDDRSSISNKRPMLVGDENRSKSSTGGDAKKRGQKFDPYTYIPLDPSVLNKRKQSSARKRMESQVNAGVKKGSTARQQSHQRGHSMKKGQKKHKG